MRGPTAAASVEFLTQLKARERRRHQRVSVKLLGRYMLGDRREFPCQTIDMSPGGLALFAPVKGEIGSKVVVYLDTIGRIEGTIVRHLDVGFAMQLVVTQAKRDRLGDQLTWLINRDGLGMPEDRRHERITPKNPSSTLRLADRRERPVRILDVSQSGGAIKTDLRPEHGTIVTIGNTQGRVVRVFDGGVAVEFLRLIPPETFDENVIL